MFYLTEELSFPSPKQANINGLLAIGGDLSVDRLLLAYHQGIFPWFNHGEPISWYSPNPRMVLFPEELKVSKTMKQVLSRKQFEISYDQAFADVIKSCSAIPRESQFGTWITNDMIEAYTELHQRGYAHSVEAWQDGRLVGGLYGVSLGKCFFGESMFAKVSNASKAAFISLVQHLQSKGFWLIDCQVYTSHLASLGARLIRRHEFLKFIDKNKEEESWIGKWNF
jgi:leucyl/phenylalanyl-tRNA--protein transferase